MASKRNRPVGVGRVIFSAFQGENHQPPFKKCKGDVKCRYKEAHAEALYSTYPLKLMVPDHASSSHCKWLYPVTYGGGLVEGDDIQLDVTVKPNCSVLLTTQSSTKIFHCDDGGTTQQTFRYKVSGDALLAVIPDPVVPYKNSKFKQMQHVDMTTSSSLVLLDWYTAGRVARGECWQFEKFGSTNKISIDGQVVHLESIRLQDTPHLSVKQAMGHYQILGSLVILGPALEELSEKLQQEYGIPKSYGSKYNSKKFFAISPLSVIISGTSVKGSVIKFAAETTAQAYGELDSMLQSLGLLLGGNPFDKKY